MQLEIFGRGIKISHKKIRGRNLRLTIDATVKNKIYSDLRKGLFEGSIIQGRNTVAYWIASGVGANPIVR